MCDTLIKLNSIKELHSFVDIIDRYPGSYEIAAGPYVVDAKSLMSLLSLDLTRPLKLTVTSNFEDEILQQIKPFILQK
ncbi:PTS HPr component phosphorylation site [Anaerostipes sp. MSJ-23]|uniref:PTS HPr component phosphorylation site n=1 Tax=unclassified Anaerostipes TaxID=2635253 RepID=UPI001C10F0B4|nr:PTS HPr component phosphorylation site [Anaerostipes sp. MSJ-23]MBU5460143.1 PTS HPr component phosphorylation site [Anaerostipes sp. MSJ-23]